MDCIIVEIRLTQFVDVFGTDRCRCAGELLGKLKHDAVWRREIGRPVVGHDCIGERLSATQRVRANLSVDLGTEVVSVGTGSVVAVVEAGYRRRDHLSLLARQTTLGRLHYLDVELR